MSRMSRRFWRPLLSFLAAAGGLSLGSPAARADPRPAPWPDARPGAVLSLEDDLLLDEVQQAAFKFFVEQTDPVTGLVRDRARSDASPSEGKASIAASGFALSAWAVAVQHGWVDRERAVVQVRKSLRFLATKAPRRHGFFYHFMEMGTGERAWKCEVSPIDTGLFFAGAIMAREYFADPEITALVNGLFHDVDWEWFLNNGQTLAMSWHDEEGFSRYRWDKYAEDMMLGFLGMGAVERPLPEGYWDAWKRVPVGTYGGFHFVEGPQLFIHQFTHAFVDFRGLRDAYADYYRNSLLASLAQRQFCMDLRDEFPSWGERLWGITSSDSIDGYKAWGGPPRTVDANALDGTIVPCAAVGSTPFVPSEAITTLRFMRTAYGDKIWSHYGFVDAFNPETGWVDTDVVAIDLGISLLQAENARTGFVWAVFMRAPEVRHALDRAGFVSQERSLAWGDQSKIRELADTVWRSVEKPAVTPDTLGLRLTAVIAASSLGLIPENDAVSRIAQMLASTAAPAGERAVAEYAAGLVTLRNAIPHFEPEATRRLNAISWGKMALESNSLGSASRLTTFFQVAAGARPASAWTDLKRSAIPEGHVYVLEPAQVLDQMEPGLWLDERAIVTGVSAAQLAYEIAVTKRKSSTTLYPYNVQSTAVLLEKFPEEVAIAMHLPLPPNWLDSATAEDRAVLLLSMANLLAPECLREWFQQDPLVHKGREAIGEFGAAAFGNDDSLFARNELAIPIPAPPLRHADIVRSDLPPDKWQWVTVEGPDYKVSVADSRPGDPDVALRFALTWDKDALHFHAVAVDTPPGFYAPAGRRSVELFINPRRDGLVWLTPDNYQFAYRPDGSAMEWFHNRAATAKITKTPQGYTVDSDIKWSELGMTPRAGLVFDLTASVTAASTNEWDPSLELSWRYYVRPDERFGLGTVRLAP